MVGRALRGLVCHFLAYWLQIAFKLFVLFHHDVCDCTRFAVMFH